MNIFHNRYVIVVLRCALAAVFIYAGASKLGAPQNFSDSIAAFAILPDTLINLVALGLPPFEIIAGLAILAGIQRRPAILGLMALTIVFVFALGAAIARGIPVDCGCFGFGKPTIFSAWVALGRDMPILAVSWSLYIREAAIKHAVGTTMSSELVSSEVALNKAFPRSEI